MKKFNKLAYALCSLAVAGTFSSCNDDYNYKYDENYEEKLVLAQYEENFKKKFGEISSDQSWDFSSGSTYYLADNDADNSKNQTRAAGSYTPVVKDYYEVENSTLYAITTMLKEHENNSKIGKPFGLKVPSNNFSIIPIYQGEASMEWTLHMVVGKGENAIDTEIWSKSEGIQTSSDGINWVDLNTNSNTLSANMVRAKEFTFENMPVGESMYFYLEITKGEKYYANTGAQMSSLAGMMHAFNVARPSNIPSNKEVMIIGCEDSNLLLSDYDMNDVVFMVVGDPFVPEIIDVENLDVVEKVAKRYMVEDLGTTDDFDFNDIVFDVTAWRDVRYVSINGVVDPSLNMYGPWHQNSVLKHVGGVLPFTLTIGDLVIADHAPGYKDLNEGREVWNWDPEKNNVSIKLPRANTSHMLNIEFPQKGSAPLIIATDQNRKWMAERVTIDWLGEALK